MSGRDLAAVEELLQRRGGVLLYEGPGRYRQDLSVETGLLAGG